MTFDAPIVVVLSPVVAVAVWFAAGWARRARIRRAAAWSEQTARIARAAGRLGSGTLGLAAGLAAVALAGPRWGEEKIVTGTRGLNLVIAVDISRSMLAEDAAGSRLARALRESRRLVQDLDGDRLGLVAFAGTSYILSPLSVDGPALTLYLDALDPEVASEGGTALAPALAQGADLLRASPEIADRVLVVFTDGEGHDSLASAAREARRLSEVGIHLILVAEGGREPVRIPVRDERGTLVAWQRDADGNVIETAREDAQLGAIADAAQGTLVAAELPDQAGAVRDLVASYKRATATESRTQRGRPRPRARRRLARPRRPVPGALHPRVAGARPGARGHRESRRASRRRGARLPRGAAAQAPARARQVESRAGGADASLVVQSPEPAALTNALRRRAAGPDAWQRRPESAAEPRLERRPE